MRLLRSTLTATSRAGIASIALLLGAGACRDGTGPGVPTPRFVALRDALQRSGVWKYDRDAGTPLTPDSVRFVFAATRAPDGRIAVIGVVPQSGSRRISEFDANGAPLRSVPIVGYEPTQLLYSPDGSRIAWFRATGADGIRTDTLLVLDAGSTTPRAVATRSWSGSGAGPGYAPLGWTPQGEIVFAAPGSFEAVSATSGARRVLLANGHFIRDYDWTTDGRIAVAGQLTAGGTRGVHLQRTAGGALETLAGSDTLAWTVRWSPDGTRIATNGAVPLAQSDGQGGQYYALVLEIFPVAGGAPRRFDGIGIWSLHDWTADGRGVLYSGVPVDEIFVGSRSWTDVYLASARGGAPRNLTNTPQIDEQWASVLP